MVHIIGKLEVVVIEGRNLPNLDKSRNKKDLSDPYVDVKLIGTKKKETKIGKTHTIDNCLDPKWNHTISVAVDEDVEEIYFSVKDKDTFKSELIGSCSVPVHTFCNTREYKGVLDLFNKKRAFAGKLVVQIKFTGSSGGSRVSYASEKVKGCVRRTSQKYDSRDGGPGNSFVHGNIILTIKSAENLPNLDMTLLNKQNKSDPYVTASLVNAENEEWKIACTKCIEDDLNPEWNETFKVPVCHEVKFLLLKVYDQDIATSEKFGSVSIPIGDIINTNFIDESFKMVGRKLSHNSRLNVSVKFEHVHVRDYEVSNCVNNSRPGNKVKLYQDAHCPTLPKTFCDLNNAWKDVEQTLKSAQHFILITGWSVKTDIKLVRGNDDDEMSLGRILYDKALNGIDVRLLLWDEITSTDSNKMGAMSTFDNKTKEYFKNSPVKVSLALRTKKPKGVLPESSYFTQCCYSHHQKTIIVDAEIPGKDKRQLTAFVGGLDLTAGRYDTPDHHLFSTLDREHKDDFYNNLVNTNAQSGPRQPWHDIHSQISGPAAKQVFKNFADRWKMQGITDDVDVNTESIDFTYSYDFQDTWSVQIFRSISEDSVKFKESKIKSLLTKKGRQIDNSLQRAYIHHIQKAEKFIYIENQYFMGSSHFWENCRDIPLKNLVPLEIAAKIVDKIKQKKHFVAYILIPMFPEGNPEDIVTQEMIHWQFHTIEMMYKMVGDAIGKEGVDAVPQDYLLFFCVGKREDSSSVPDHLRQPLDEKAALVFSNRRSMIYVHSKMAIFDDEYILVGSANINDRSLGGTRDTEIAMGAYQPNVGADGDVANFRKCLWSEHLGVGAPLHLHPGTRECAKAVRGMAEEALVRYIDLTKPLPESHLMLYPLAVNENGKVTSRSDCENYPDYKASVLGMRSRVLPTELTT